MIRHHGACCFFQAARRRCCMLLTTALRLSKGATWTLHVFAASAAKLRASQRGRRVAQGGVAAETTSPIGRRVPSLCSVGSWHRGACNQFVGRCHWRLRENGSVHRGANGGAGAGSCVWASLNNEGHRGTAAARSVAVSSLSVSRPLLRNRTCGMHGRTHTVSLLQDVVLTDAEFC